MSAFLFSVLRHHLPRGLFLPAMLLLLTGCAGLMQAPQDQPRARAVLNFYGHANHDLIRFKGLGRVHLSLPAVNMAGRLALAGEMPDKMRIEWLAPTGQPLLRMAADGRTIAVFSSQTDEVHRLNQSDAALERIIQIPISVESLLAVLSGRLPVADEAAARVLKESTSHVVVALVDRWSATLAEVEVNLDQQRITQYTALGPEGGLQYRIRWLQWQLVEGYLLPREVEFLGNDRRRMQLTMDRYWCNVPLPHGIFSEVVPGQQ